MTQRSRGRVPSFVAFDRSVILPLAVLVIGVATALIAPAFIAPGNLANTVRTAALLSVLAVGQSFVLISGGFDLSNGAVVALSSIVMALTIEAVGAVAPDQVGLTIAAGVVAALLAGTLVALVNGALVHVLRLSGFIVTLGSMSVVMGLVFLVTNGVPIYGLPVELVRGFGRASLGYLSLPTWTAIAVILLFVVVQRHTAVGRHVYAVGSNASAARVSGISIWRTTIFAYLMSSLAASVVGILLTAQVGSGQATLGGERLMLQSIAAAVIGGVSLQGGAGSAVLVVAGAFFLTILGNALNIVRVDSKLQVIVVGVILLVVAGINEAAQRRQARARA